MRQDPRFEPRQFDGTLLSSQPYWAVGGEDRGCVSLDDAVHLHDLAVSLQVEGRLREAETLCRQALSVFEAEAGPNHPDVANILNTLAAIYAGLGDGAEAERLAQRSVAIMEGVTGGSAIHVMLELSSDCNGI